ncbi:hypothetical protein [Microvirga sp. M2]|uniref:hypothetical protein n=1 Tax=Microvirga sp. M2 TaxID=3073270 RepID=UPI0039C3C0E8
MQPEFQVIGARNGWLLIHDPHWADYGADNQQVLYKGSGWVAPGLIAFDMEGYTLFSKPRIGAAVLLTLKGPEEEWTGANVRVEQVHGCSGGFLDITVRKKGGTRSRGWFAAICGNQGTTCSFGNEPLMIEERRGKLISATDLD